MGDRVSYGDAEPTGFHRNEARFCLQHLLPRFSISGRSCHQNFGSLIVGSGSGRVKHEQHIEPYSFPEIPACDEFEGDVEVKLLLLRPDLMWNQVGPTRARGSSRSPATSRREPRSSKIRSRGDRSLATESDSSTHPRANTRSQRTLQRR